MLATGLLAFRIGHIWLKASRSPSSSLPPPYQYFLTSHMITQASPLSFLRFFTYALGRRPTGSSGRSRKPLSRMLGITAGTLLLLLTLSIGIKVTDILLHDQIRSSIIFLNHTKAINASAYLNSALCEPRLEGCSVLLRTLEASDGGRNMSDTFAVYEVPYNSSTNASSTAYVGPPRFDASITGTGHTIAAATTCDVFRPICNAGGGGGEVFGCAGINDPTQISYNTTTWSNRPQILLPSQSGDLFQGTTSNPFQIAGFVCFSDYSGIAYSDDSYTFPTPFASWYGFSHYGDGMGGPAILCSIFVCSTTVYDAHYSISDGATQLLHETLEPANASTTLAISSSMVYIKGLPSNTSLYAYTPRYIDDQFQVDVSAAGNSYGNDTTRYASALAQSLSNRMVGWSAGAIRLGELEVNATEPILAIAIPLVTAGVFTGLHFLYALVIIGLGISCLSLPAQYHPGTLLSAENGEAGPAAGRPRAHMVSDLAVAQLRLTDSSTLVHEVIVRHAQLSDAQNQVHFRGDDASVRSRSRHSIISSKIDLEDMEADDDRATGVVRLALLPDPSGDERLRLSVRLEDD